MTGLPLEREPDGTGLAASFFSANYVQARAVFLRAAEETGAVIETYENEAAKGPAGEALYTDIAETGQADAPSLLLLISGTHGVEGFCGSASQTGLLQSGLGRMLPDTVRIVMVHALNPYGFAWERRVTEDNVDLNRNFIDHNAQHPANPGYTELNAAIAPPDVDSETLRQANEALKNYADIHGRAALQAAITSGQYSHADGLYFGGQQAAWSNRLFAELLARKAGPASRIGIVDFHTGLGPYGVGELISEFDEDAPEYERACAFWGEDVTSTLSGSSVSSVLTGTLDTAAVRLLPGREVTPATLEFGTYPPNTVFEALRADNWLHAQGLHDTAEAKAIKAEIRRAFYPERDDWKAMVWERSHEVVSQAVEALG